VQVGASPLETTAQERFASSSRSSPGEVKQESFTPSTPSLFAEGTSQNVAQVPFSSPEAHNSQEMGPGPSTPAASFLDDATLRLWQETAQFAVLSPSRPPLDSAGALLIHDGELAGHVFLLDYPVITVGRGIESDIVIDDISISRWHAQFSCQATGNYVQDLASRNGTRVNDQPLAGPHLLTVGDRVSIGTIGLEYISIQAARTIPLPLLIRPQSYLHSMSGPIPLRLPSKKIQ
jgi:hypothetical protein